jgi:dienelactone hydrolase
LGKVLHDVRVALDYLATRPEVDPSRIGFIGHSYGGRMAIWVPVFDRRVAVSVSHCGAHTYADHLRLGLTIQPEFVVPGIAERTDLGEIAGLSRADLLLSSTTEDRWSPSAQSVYDTASAAGGNVSLRLWPGGHVFTAEMRTAACSFLGRAMLPRSPFGAPRLATPIPY